MSASKILEKMRKKHGSRVQETPPEPGEQKGPRFRLPEGSTIEACYKGGLWRVTLRTGDGNLYATTKVAIHTAIQFVGKSWFRDANNQKKREAT